MSDPDKIGSCFGNQYWNFLLNLWDILFKNDIAPAREEEYNGPHQN